MPKKHIIHVNRQHIAMNASNGTDLPVYTIKHMDGKTYCAREVDVLGPSKMVYNGTQLNCGARAWIETTADLIMKDQMSFFEARMET